MRYISPIWGEAPTEPIFTKKLHSSCRPRHDHVCKLLNWNFQGLRFYRWSIFPFSYWLLHGPYNSAAVLRCLWSKTAVMWMRFYFGFVIRDLAHFGRLKSTCRLNFGRYFNQWLRQYYFHFLKTNVRHVGILLPVFIFTFASLSACHSASAYQISSKSDHPRHSYGVASISKMAATASQFYFRFRFASLSACHSVFAN